MIVDRLKEDMKSAMKAGEKERLGVIRMLLSELKNARIERGEDLNESEEQKILAAYAKKRKDVVAMSVEGGRQDLADKEQREYDITMSYLPEQMGEDELRAIIGRHIRAYNADAKAFGQIMRAVLDEVGGAADGKTISVLLKQALQ